MNSKKNIIRKILIGLSLYGFVFLFYLYLRNSELSIEKIFLGAVISLSWLISSLLVRKFDETVRNNFRAVLITYLESLLMMLGILAVFIYFIDQSDVSRYLLLNTLITASSLEIILVAFPIIKIGSALKIGFPKFSIRIFLVQFVLFLFLVLYIHLQILDHSYKGLNYYLFLSSLMFFWLFVSIISHNFNREPQKNFWSYIWQYLREYLLLGSVSIFLLFTFRFSVDIAYSYIFGLVVYSGWSFVILAIQYPRERVATVDVNKYRLLRAPTLVDFNLEKFIPENVMVQNQNGGGNYYTNHGNGSDEAEQRDKYIEQENEANKTFTGLSSKLAGVYLAKLPEVNEFLSRSIDLGGHKLEESIVIRSRDIYNVETIEAKTLTFFLNLHEMNDLRRVNQYLIEVNRTLKPGGIFIGVVEPIVLRYNRFIKTYPFYLARFFYFLDFLWNRVLPKLPFLQKIYFGITDGKGRALSLAESLGRLYYCGFEIIDAKVIDNFVYFISAKKHEPRTDKNPSFGPLFKMKRLGKDGKTIYVFKARTMHPYAEYLQEYVYKLGSLAEGGKFKDDFRITTWGRVFRKLWIDELPMLINWLKRDLKLVGVRPLSAHYLSLYREDLRLRRLKYKPGLLPPFYADLPKTLEEIMDSEERYLTAYEKNPIMTDIKYFFKAVGNILLKGARSA